MFGVVAKCVGVGVAVPEDVLEIGVPVTCVAQRQPFDIYACMLGSAVEGWASLKWSIWLKTRNGQGAICTVLPFFKLCIAMRCVSQPSHAARLPIFSHTEVRWDSVTPLGRRLPEHREGTKKQYRGEKTCWRGREGGSQPKARRSDFRKISKSINAGEGRREKGQLFDAHLHCTRRCFQKLKLPIFECD